MIGNARCGWCFDGEPEPGVGGRVIRHPRGKVLGGSTAINSRVAIRGRAADYDGWCDLGLPGWGWRDVLPYFKRSEDHVLGAGASHGAGVNGRWLHRVILDGRRATGLAWRGAAGQVHQATARRAVLLAAGALSLAALLLRTGIGPAGHLADLGWNVLAFSCAAIDQPFDAHPGLTMISHDLRPSSRGWLRRAGPDARLPPRILMNYLTTARDRQVAAAGLRLTRRTTAAPALAGRRPVWPASA